MLYERGLLAQIEKGAEDGVLVQTSKLTSIKRSGVSKRGMHEHTKNSFCKTVLCKISVVRSVMNEVGEGENWFPENSLCKILS